MLEVNDVVVITVEEYYGANLGEIGVVSDQPESSMPGIESEAGFLWLYPEYFEKIGELDD